MRHSIGLRVREELVYIDQKKKNLLTQLRIWNELKAICLYLAGEYSLKLWKTSFVFCSFCYFHMFRANVIQRDKNLIASTCLNHRFWSAILWIPAKSQVLYHSFYFRSISVSLVKMDVPSLCWAMIFQHPLPYRIRILTLMANPPPIDVFWYLAITFHSRPLNRQVGRTSGYQYLLVKIIFFVNWDKLEWNGGVCFGSRYETPNEKIMLTRYSGQYTNSNAEDDSFSTDALPLFAAHRQYYFLSTRWWVANSFLGWDPNKRVPVSVAIDRCSWG